MLFTVIPSPGRFSSAIDAAFTCEVFLLLVDYHLHPMGHGEGRHHREVLVPFFQTAVKKGIGELGIADHGRYYMDFQYQEIRDLGEEYPDLSVRLGVELPFLPSCAQEMESIVQSLQPDFVIGSLHHIDGWMFDHPGFLQGYSHWDPHRLYSRYFSLMEELVQVDSFDIIGHLDLIKVFGLQPPGDILSYVEPVLLAIKRQDKVVELNTAGWRKPAREFYPSTTILTSCRELDIPVTLGSDAHVPSQVGSMFTEARDLLKSIGYSQVATFLARERMFVELE